jgi:hypothetical protein
MGSEATKDGARAGLNPLLDNNKKVNEVRER